MAFDFCIPITTNYYRRRACVLSRARIAASVFRLWCLTTKSATPRQPHVQAPQELRALHTHVTRIYAHAVVLREPCVVDYYIRITFRYYIVHAHTITPLNNVRRIRRWPLFSRKLVVPRRKFERFGYDFFSLCCIHIAGMII